MHLLTVRELAKEIFYGIFLFEYEFPRAMQATILLLTYVNIIYIDYFDYKWPCPLNFKDLLEFRKLSDEINGSVAKNGEF